MCQRVVQGLGQMSQSKKGLVTIFKCHLWNDPTFQLKVSLSRLTNHYRTQSKSRKSRDTDVLYVKRESRDIPKNTPRPKTSNLENQIEKNK